MPENKYCATEATKGFNFCLLNRLLLKEYFKKFFKQLFSRIKNIDWIFSKLYQIESFIYDVCKKLNNWTPPFPSP